MFAWSYMAREAHAMNLSGVCRCAGMKMSGPDTHPWSAATLAPLFLIAGCTRLQQSPPELKARETLRGKGNTFRRVDLEVASA